MKSLNLLLFVATTLIGISPLCSQVISGNATGEVTEFTHSEKHTTLNQSRTTVNVQPEHTYDSEDTLKHWSGNQVQTEQQAPVASRIARAENTGLPAYTANITPLNQGIDLNDSLVVKTSSLGEIAKANRAPLTPKQIKAKTRLAKANAKAAEDLARTDAAKAAALIPKNSVFNAPKFLIYGQLGVGDEKLGGLNLMLASKSYPTAGAYSYRAELGTLYRLSEENTLDVGLRYGLMNGLEKSQRFDRPSTGQLTESKSTMWLVGLQSGLDHNLLNDSDWSVAIGLGLGAEVGGLHLTERIQEMVATLPTDPSIPTPDEVAVLHYNVVNVSVTPRLTLRTPEMSNGWQFQARVGYQFGKNAVLRVDEFTSIRNDVIYNPSGIAASAGFVAPLPRIFRK